MEPIDPNDPLREKKRSDATIPARVLYISRLLEGNPSTTDNNLGNP